MKGWKGTDPWDKYKALKGKGIPNKAPSTEAKTKTPPPAPQAATPPTPPPAPSLGGDAQAALAQAALAQATRANPPKQWDQPGGPAAPDTGNPPAPPPAPEPAPAKEAKQPSPSGQDLGNPPSLVNKADRPFTAKEIAQIMKDAKAAIAKGAPRDKVAQRLKENGLDPSGLDENG